VRNAIGAANVNQAKGSFDGPARASTIDANDQLRSADEYRNLIIAYKNGRPVLLSDLADTIDDAENNRLAAWADDKAALIVNVQRSPVPRHRGGGRGEGTAAQLHSLLRRALECAAERPHVTIRASVNEFRTELFIAVALVVMVIFLFCAPLAAPSFPSVAVPLYVDDQRRLVVGPGRQALFSASSMVSARSESSTGRPFL